METDTPTGVETKHTFCRVCHAACPMEVDIEDNRVRAVRGVMDDPLFEGYTCIKGRQIPDQMADPKRIKMSLRRRPDGTFEEASSTEAMDEIATKLREIIDTHGPRAVASYTGTGGYQNSVAVGAARAFHQGLDSVSFYTSVTIDQPAKGLAMLRLGGWEAGYHSFTDSDVHMAIGYNSMVSSYAPIGGLQGTNPFTVMRRRKAEGMKLIVIDPRRTELASFADIHLQVRPGQDTTLLAGMIRIVLEEGLQDHEFCERWIDQMGELEAAVSGFTLDVVAERTQLDPDDIVAATRMFAAGPRGTAGTGTGPNMAAHSSLTEHMTVVLNTILGRVNREGDLLENGLLLYPEMPHRAQATAPRNPANGPEARIRNLRGYRGEMPAATLAEEILTPGDGQIRALIVSGGNPVVAFPDHELTMKAMEALDLLVVIDYRMTPTAELADYVVAPTLPLERADVPHLMDRWFRAPYTNYTEAVVERDGDVLNEWEVFWELASRLGSTLPLPGGTPDMTVRPSTDEMIDRTYHGSRMPLDEVRSNLRTVHLDKKLVVDAAEDGASARFTPAPDDLMAELAEVLAETGDTFAGTDVSGYPFRLVSRRLKHVLNSTGTELPGLARKGTTNPAYMNPADVAELGLESGDVIEISSPSAALLGVVEPADDVKRGVISMAHSWGGRSLTDEKVREIGSPTSRLVSVDVGHDPVTGMVVSSAIPVAVAKATEAVA
ncbi:molybdopterin-containing oxidoreductase family protein [Ilumatobacter sp.]|uniref:molybdopterin-containing oxidoreductase family protein n=1 Tax=Ilumatobacter sp. TaxID=1967498 RepID=UPI003C33C854